ncbi:MAG: P1 family peptidase [Alphaproteobacteria bacterium]|nr:P1 family peptidase [Alphaproteobacteria bacterium]
MLSNTLTDIPGLSVGQAHDAAIRSGTTVILPPLGSIAAVDVRGGGPGTLETDALGLDGTVDEVHAIVLSGGSAFGLAASSGVRDALARQGKGFAIQEARVPIVTQAILFDLLNGGNKEDLSNAYRSLGEQACAEASTGPVALGSVGAGYGATTATLRGGLGSASTQVSNGIRVAALVAANPVGTITMGTTPHFWAHAFELNREFGGLGAPADWVAPQEPPPLKGGPGQNTTLAVIATNARLDKRQAKRLAIISQTGLARAIHPVHTPLDGDVVFSLATGEKPLSDPVYGLAILGSAAADTLARATARAIYEAAPTPDGWQGPPSYRQQFT